MTMKMRTISAAALATVLASAQAYAAFFVTNRYDIDANAGTEVSPNLPSPPNPSPTAAGWTSVNNSTAATLTTPGIVLDDSHTVYGGAYYRPLGSHQPAPPGQPPVEVYQEAYIGYGQTLGSGEPTLRFRDITPAGARRVTITVYRADPADGFGALFTSHLSIDGDPLTQFHAGGGPGGPFYFAPIVYTTALHEKQTIGTLDIALFDSGGPGNSQVRINGFEFVYEIPEPTTAAVLAACSTLLLRRWR